MSLAVSAVAAVGAPVTLATGPASCGLFLAARHASQTGEDRPPARQLSEGKTKRPRRAAQGAVRREVFGGRATLAPTLDPSSLSAMYRKPWVESVSCPTHSFAAEEGWIASTRLNPPVPTVAEKARPTFKTRRDMHRRPNPT